MVLANLNPPRPCYCQQKYHASTTHSNSCSFTYTPHPLLCLTQQSLMWREVRKVEVAARKHSGFFRNCPTANTGFQMRDSYPSISFSHPTFVWAERIQRASFYLFWKKNYKTTFLLPSLGWPQRICVHSYPFHLHEREIRTNCCQLAGIPRVAPCISAASPANCNNSVPSPFHFP